MTIFNANNSLFVVVAFSGCLMCVYTWLFSRGDEPAERTEQPASPADSLQNLHGQGSSSGFPTLWSPYFMYRLCCSIERLPSVQKPG